MINYNVQGQAVFNLYVVFLHVFNLFFFMCLYKYYMEEGYVVFYDWELDDFIQDCETEFGGYISFD